MTEALSPHDDMERVQRGEAVVVDLRSPAAFARGHPAGAISLLYSERGLAERIAVAAPGSNPVAVIASSAEEAAGAAAQIEDAGRVFLSAVSDDQADWQAAGVPWETMAEVSVFALRARQDEDRVVLDVREQMEWETGYVPGAVLIPLGRVRQELDRLPRDREIAVICEAGVRSATAASILQAAGFARVANVPDGSAMYRALGWPLAFPAHEEARGQ